MRRFLLPLLVLILPFFAACACRPAFPTLSNDDLLKHVIVIDSDGHALDPRDNRTPMSTPRIPPEDPRSAFYQQVRGILEAIDQVPANADPAHTRRIMLYVHGGLVPLQQARANAARVCVAMRNDPETADIYPLFIDWPSDFPSTYAEEMRFIRKGAKDRTPWTGFAAPLFVLANLGSGIAQAPIVWVNLAGEDGRTLTASMSNWVPGQQHDSMWDNPRLLPAARFFKVLNDLYLEDFLANRTPAHISISIGQNQIPTGEWVARGLSYVATAPVKMATGPLINGLGKPAWENMRRRTQTMFESPDAFDVTNKTTEQIRQTLEHGQAGALSFLLYELARKCEADYPAEAPRDLPPGAPAAAPAPVPPAHYQVTLMAHSMGAIVANSIMNRFPHLPIDNVVYMGAACTIDDMRGSLVPFMQAHAGTQFYNLCLHPIAETLDTEGFDFVPRGSLLIWIDNFLENPRTPLDRTLGRWENIVEATYVFPESTRGRVHIKSFDLLPMSASCDQLAVNPQKHGDFSHTTFWKQEFWKPANPIQHYEPLYHQLDEISRAADARARQAGS